MKMLVVDKDGNEIEREFPDEITLTFKNPDAATMAIDDMVDSIDNLDLDRESQDELDSHYRKLLSKWVEYGEYVSITFDFVNQTAKVNSRS